MSQPAELFRTSIVIDAPPEHVFRFWLDPRLLVTWLGISARVDARPGGEFRFEVAPGEWCSGHYLEIEPPDRLVVTWGWESGRIALAPGSSRLEVEFHESGSGTRLELVHRGLSGDILRLHADGWPRFLARLDTVATGRDTGPPLPAETPEAAIARLNQRHTSEQP